MPLFPIFADLAGRSVLVVGGGEVALRKIEALLQAGAKVGVHAIDLHATLARWCDEGRIERLLGAFDAAWLDDAWLLIVATDDVGLNARLAAEATHRRLLANVVDDARLSSFHVPAVINRAPLQLAISSGGAAPMLARRLRERLESELDDSLGELAAMFARHRDEIRQRLPDLALRRRWFDHIIDGPVTLLLRAGNRDAAQQAFLSALRDAGAEHATGSVSLVGTGDGPGQLTLNALRAMNRADSIVYDDDVDAGVLQLARKDALRVPAPATPGACFALLHERAHRGERVVWLKRGDAFRQPANAPLSAQFAAAGTLCETIAGVRD